MKMQTTVYAPCDGVVEIHAALNDTVEARDLLAHASGAGSAVGLLVQNRDPACFGADRFVDAMMRGWSPFDNESVFPRGFKTPRDPGHALGSGRVQAVFMS